MTGQEAERGRRLPGRPWWWAAAAVAIVVAVVLVWRGIDGGDEAGAVGSEGSAASSPSSSPEAGPSSSPSVDGFGSPAGTPSPGQTEPGLAETPTATPRPVRAPIGDAVDLGDGVGVDVVKLESVQGQGTGPGERDAPAVRFTIELTNGTSSDLDLRATTVTAYSGPDLDPASDLGRPGVKLFPASAAAGESVQGVYEGDLPGLGGVRRFGQCRFPQRPCETMATRKHA
jgi:hypothetical protein